MDKDMIGQYDLMINNSYTATPVLPTNYLTTEEINLNFGELEKLMILQEPNSK